MKRINFIYFLLVIVMSCEKEKSNRSELRIKTNSSKIKLAKIIRPIDGFILWKNKADTVNVDEMGIIKYQFNLSAPEVIRVWAGENFLEMIVQENQTYEIDLTDSIPKFSLDNAKGNTLLNEVKRPYNGTYEVERMFRNDTTAFLLSKKIDSLKKIETEALSALLVSNDIDQEFYDVFQNEINYYYADKTLNAIPRKIDNSMSSSKGFRTLSNSTLEKYPIEADVLNLYWTDYADTVIYRTVDSLLTQGERDKLYKNDEYFEFIDSLITMKFAGKYREKLLAQNIIFNAKQKEYNKSLVLLLDNFKSSYPNSVYTQYLEPEIEEIKGYHKKIKGDLSTSVKIIKNDNINSFSELLKQFKGQKLYIDLMATWCGPCKREFKYNVALQKILEDNSYKKLYISIDEPDRKQKWLDMIKYYELNGFHFLFNKNFKDDFAKKYTRDKGYFTIPQYLIVDENGNIVEKDAPRPSESKELKKLLSTLN